MIETFAHVMFLMVAGHALADRPLQTERMSKEKTRAYGANWRIWIPGLAFHGLIHGGIVALIAQHFAGLWWLGVVETLAHAAIDDAKCMSRIGILADQSAHIACKLAYAVAIMWAVA